MDITLQEITLVIVGSAFFLLVAVGIVILFLVYQKKQLQNFIQKQQMQNQFQQELLNTRLEVQEHTLNVVGQEIHDNIGQVLSLVKLNLSKALSDQAQSAILLQTKELINKAIHDLRILSKTLNSGYLSDTPLSESIKNDLIIVQQSGSFKTEIHVLGEEPDLDPQKKLVIFRMAQELLHNALKHSRGNLIRVLISCSENKLRLQIEDNGIGIDSEKADSRGGTGLGNLFVRAGLIGADFSINNGEEKGTKATLILPL